MIELDKFYAALFIAGLAWWAWRANRPSKSDDSTETMKFETPTVCKPLHDDPFLADVEKTREEEQRRADANASRCEAQVEADVAHDEALKARLMAFAKKNELDKILAEFAEQIRHLPAWSQRADWTCESYGYLPLADISEQEIDSNKSAVSFSYQGSNYRLERRSWFGHDSGGVELSLFENGEEVFGVNCGQHDDEYSSWLSPFDVTAFKRHGQWATMLLRMQTEMHIAGKESSADVRRNSAKAIAAKFADHEG